MILTTLHPGKLVDNELELVLYAVEPRDPMKQMFKQYVFHMKHSYTQEYMGYLNLRFGTEEELLYDGNIGFEVEPKFRGNHYAARACQLIFPFAKQLGINPVWITCRPDNIPSRKTCERVGGKMIEIIDIPKNHYYYNVGERQKCRYRVDV